MPIIVRRSRIHRWSIAFIAIFALAAAAAVFCFAAAHYGWLAREQVSGIGGLFSFATLMAYVYVVMNWIESGGWTWSLIADDRCIEASREFLKRLADGESEEAFELTDSATFGEGQQGFARLVGSWIAGQTLVSICEKSPTAGSPFVPPRYRVFAGMPFSLVEAEFSETPDQITYVPTLRLVQSGDRYVVQAIEIVVMGRRRNDEVAWSSCGRPQDAWSS
jgi:hypothetical protein